MKYLTSKITYFNRGTTKSQRIRYKIVELILKRITPSFYKKTVDSIRLTRKFFDMNRLTIIPRPSIKAMKIYFNNKSVKGVEIGVKFGINAESILKELNIEKLFLVDPWVNEAHLKEAFYRFRKSNKGVFIKEISSKAVSQFKDNSLDFVYIDGNHSFDFVLEDIYLWYSKIKNNGIIAGHDVFVCEGVLDAVREFCFEKGIGYFVDYPDWYIIKREGVLIE